MYKAVTCKAWRRVVGRAAWGMLPAECYAGRQKEPIRTRAHGSGLLLGINNIN